MLYKTNSDLPEAVQNKLPEDAQTIYRETYNDTWDNYAEQSDDVLGSRDETSHRMAWAGVKRAYGRTENGKWIRKESR
ncbi:MAG TPA: ChaB family protein [Patescibacteria group bacterium]|nr:ChaB family protein [Patescibacteria group bacterium]